MAILLLVQQLSVSGERNLHQVLVTCLWEASPETVARISDCPDMTLVVEYGYKACTQMNK